MLVPVWCRWGAACWDGRTEWGSNLVREGMPLLYRYIKSHGVGGARPGEPLDLQWLLAGLLLIFSAFQRTPALCPADLQWLASEKTVDLTAG
jgi:hypothetical protein